MRLLNVASTLSSSKNKYVYMQIVIKEIKKKNHAQTIGVLKFNYV